MPTIQTTDQVALLIDGAEFSFWSDLELHLSVDSYATVGFSAPFEVRRREFRETFRPFSFKPLQVLLGGSPLFTGTLVDVSPKLDANSSSVTVTGYSLPAVFADCTAPASILPLEFKNLGLRRIAEALGRPFGVSVEFRDPEGTPFEKVALETDQKIQDFLVDLARQRNLVLSSSPDGALLVWKSVSPGRPVAKLVEGTPPVTAVTASFSPQEYYSEITGFASAKRGKKGSKYTQKNRWLTSTLRPLSFKLDDTERADAPEATRAKLGRMFASMAAFTVDDLPTWRDPKGALWQPNTTLTLAAPNCMVYRETELLIRDVTLKQNASGLSASLGLVLPGAFSGEIPEELPWDA